MSENYPRPWHWEYHNNNGEPGAPFALVSANDKDAVLATDVAPERIGFDISAEAADFLLRAVNEVDELRELVRSAFAIADREGANTAWDRFKASAAKLGLNGITARTSSTIECHGLDTLGRVCFYEPDFYVFSNFSAFNLRWEGLVFPTSEHAYQWEKFWDVNNGQNVKKFILHAPSAHQAYKIAQEFKAERRNDWDQVKMGIMRNILRAKAKQHEYVRRKLLATGDRELVENSWRDDFWGWGPNRDGQNMLGKLWMEIRAELRAKA